jgi:hypothetical protein
MYIEQVVKLLAMLLSKPGTAFYVGEQEIDISAGRYCHSGM